MDGVNLERFQFDFDMSWACVFLAHDGAVLGRYGSRDSDVAGSEDLISTAGFRAAMARVLELHAQYPENRLKLAGKQPRRLGFAKVEDIDARRRQGFGSCYHCHHVQEALLRDRIVGGRGLDARSVWPYPTAARLGVSLDPDKGLTVVAVDDDSIADRAGVEVGDELRTLDGQPLVSHADIQWALHHADDVASMGLVLQRGDSLETLTLTLAEGWRRGAPGWRESFWGIRPGFDLTRLGVAERAKAGAPEHGMALKVSRVFGGAVRAGGVIRNDVITTLDGVSDDWDESDALLHLRSHRRPGDRVAVQVLRRGESLDLEIVLD